MSSSSNNHSRSRGTARLSTQRPTIKESNSKPSTANQEISSYFVATSSNNSPYKCLSEIKQIELKDENDFKSPLPIRMTRSGVQNGKTNAKRKYTKKVQTKKKDNLQQKTLKDFCNDVNPEHLELALALSVQEMKQTESVDVEDDDCVVLSYASTQQIRENAKITLEQYGFHSIRKRKNVSDARVNNAVNSRKKKSRFYHIPSTLTTRTDEEREEMINAKISQILCQSEDNNLPTFNYDHELLHSDILKEIYCENNKLYKMNGFNLDELNASKCLYVDSLNLEHSKNDCGQYLKKWENIAGRDLTPPREYRKSSTNLIQSVNKNCDDLQMNDYNIDELQTKVGEIQSSHLSEDVVMDTAKNDEFKDSAIDLIFQSNSTATVVLDLDKNDQMASKTNQVDDDLSNIIASAKISVKENLSELTGDNENSSTPTRKMRSQSISPDLFDSEDDTIENPLNFEELNNVTNCNDIPNSLLVTDAESPLLNGSKFKRKISYCSKASPLNNLRKKQLNLSEDLSDCEIVETDNGICHFESFCDDGSVLSQKCMDKNDTIDLTLSSDSENELNSNIHKFDDNEEFQTSAMEKSHAEIIQASPRISDYDNKSMNATAYVNNLLNNSVEIAFNANKSEHQISPLKYRSIDIPLDKIEENCSHFKKHDSTASIESNASQDSIYVSDDELNYSSVYCTPKKNTRVKQRFEISESESDDEVQTNADIEDSVNVNEILKKLHAEVAEIKRNKSLVDVIDISDDDCCSENCENAQTNQNSLILQDCEEKNDLNEIANNNEKVSKNISIINDNPTSKLSKKIQHPRVAELSKSNKIVHDFLDDTFGNLLEDSNVVRSLDSHITPEKSKLLTEPILTPQGTTLLKTNDVTPMPDYDTMDTPQIQKELDRFGLKKIKRQRGVQMLKYLYDSTHPALHCDDDEECGKVVKRRRKLIDDEDDPGGDVTNELSLKHVTEVLKLGSGNVQIVGDALSDRLSIDEMIFEKKQLKKILSCQLPLHIAWHNLLAAHPELRENILLYEPLQVEVLYGMLKEQGFKYQIQDLISFLDKKCITIRIAQNQNGPRTKKRSK